MYRSATSNLTKVENGNKWCQTRANNEAPSIGNVAPQKAKEVPAYSPTADKAELISGAIPAIINAIAAYAQYRDRKSTRLNSSHVRISYAVFCLKKKTSCKYK